MKSRKLKISILLIATLGATLGIYSILANVGPKGTGLAGDNTGFSLVRPAFAESMAATTSFLNQEAGIAIWLNATANAPLNINQAKNHMVNVENVTSDYVIGSLSDNGGIVSSDDYPHCIVFASGWIVVYYLKIDTQNAGTTGWIGKIIDWDRYSNNQLNGNYLSEAMYYIAYTTLGLSINNEQYYHFQYPSATKLMFAIKHAPNGATVTFNINVPDTLTIYEYSWACNDTNVGYTFKIDSTTISSEGGAGRYYGGPQITPTILSADYWHTVSLAAGYNYYGNDAYVCLILLYA